MNHRYTFVRQRKIRRLIELNFSSEIDSIERRSDLLSFSRWFCLDSKDLESVIIDRRMYGDAKYVPVSSTNPRWFIGESLSSASIFHSVNKLYGTSISFRSYLSPRWVSFRDGLVGSKDVSVMRKLSNSRFVYSSPSIYLTAFAPFFFIYLDGARHRGDPVRPRRECRPMRVSGEILERT